MSSIRSACLIALAMMLSGMAHGDEDFARQGEKALQKKAQRIDATNVYVRLLADIHVLLADIHIFLCEDYDRATKDCDLAIRLDAKNHDAYFSRGVSFWMKRDYERSLAEYSFTGRGCQVVS
jgi:hypothetical protein